MYRADKRAAIKQYGGGATRGSLFRALARPQSQYLTRAELRPFARRLGMSSKRLFNLMDTNRDGRVSRAEFRAFMKKMLGK